MPWSGGYVRAQALRREVLHARRWQNVDFIHGIDGHVDRKRQDLCTDFQDKAHPRRPAQHHCGRRRYAGRLPSSGLTCAASLCARVPGLDADRASSSSLPSSFGTRRAGAGRGPGTPHWPARLRQRALLAGRAHHGRPAMVSCAPRAPYPRDPSSAPSRPLIVQKLKILESVGLAKNDFQICPRWAKGRNPGRLSPRRRQATAVAPQVPVIMNKRAAKKWSSRESEPVPLACKASALPNELEPHTRPQATVYIYYIKVCPGSMDAGDPGDVDTPRPPSAGCPSRTGSAVGRSRHTRPEVSCTHTPVQGVLCASWRKACPSPARHRLRRDCRSAEMSSSEAFLKGIPEIFEAELDESLKARNLALGAPAGRTWPGALRSPGTDAGRRVP